MNALTNTCIIEFNQSFIIGSFCLRACTYMLNKHFKEQKLLTAVTLYLKVTWTCSFDSLWHQLEICRLCLMPHCGTFIQIFDSFSK